MQEKIFTDQNFKEEVESVKGVVLVDFWAPWCGPCKMQGPIIESLAKEVENATVGKLNVDENAETAGKFGVMSIPTLILFKDGKPVESMVGLHQKDDLKAKIDEIAK